MSTHVALTFFFFFGRNGSYSEIVPLAFRHQLLYFPVGYAIYSTIGGKYGIFLFTLTDDVHRIVDRGVYGSFRYEEMPSLQAFILYALAYYLIYDFVSSRRALHLRWSDG